MKFNIFDKTVCADFVAIDSQFPQKDPFGFRNVELNEYIKGINNFKAYTMYPMPSWGNAWFPWGYGVDRATYNENKKGYLRFFKQNNKNIEYLNRRKRYSFKLAYSFFLAETYVLLPFYEKNKIPFVFILYPGGAFGLHNIKSDQMLEGIFNSEYFRAVIVTQKITEDYLLEKKLCSKEKMHYIHGGFSQFNKEDIKQKKYFKKDKKTFDICFVSGKYSEQGKDKGYDLFIESARELCKKADDIRFHVVGGLTIEDIELGDIASKVTFYGYKKPEFLSSFYASIDILLSPNRPSMLYEGNFDGFPLAIDAPFCGVAQFASDELGMNRGQFIEEEEIVIVPLNAKSIAVKVLFYYNNPKKLYELSEKGQIKTIKLFSIKQQANERIKVFNKLVSLEMTKK